MKRGDVVTTEAESLSVTMVREDATGDILLVVSLYRFPEGNVLESRMGRLRKQKELPKEVDYLVARWQNGGHLGLAAHFEASEVDWVNKA